MGLATILYLGVTFGLLVIFALLVWRTYRSKNRQRMEEAKHRMLEEE
ncbi:MAG: CcoQ/FixQ family Cbb3-type cytochrome c oxidase assembly chaperone [Desulfuromonas sp.]|nr:MAG: CcoQ/FixQ family Cbb3-type cytochrome c oxidase assembly chaperone [Desulfuromonas sp.]